MAELQQQKRCNVRSDPVWLTTFPADFTHLRVWAPGRGGAIREWGRKGDSRSPWEAEGLGRAGWEGVGAGTKARGGRGAERAETSRWGGCHKANALIAALGEVGPAPQFADPQRGRRSTRWERGRMSSDLNTRGFGAERDPVRVSGESGCGAFGIRVVAVLGPRGQG